MYRYFTLLGQEVALYNLFIGLSLIFGIRELQAQIKRYSTCVIIEKNFEYLLIPLIIGGFFFASIFEDIYHQTSISFGKNGITFYGGLLFGLTFIFIMSRLLKFSAINFFNISVPSIFLSHAIGRVGCFLAGCCYGVPCTNYFCFSDQYGVQRLPIQLIESVLLIFGYFISQYFGLLKYRAVFYLIYYPFLRFILEVYRNDDRGILLQNLFSPSQVISLSLLLLAAVIVFRLKHSKAFI